MFRILLFVTVLVVGWYGLRWLGEPLGLPVPVTINELTEKPSNFDGKVVAVSGKVVERFSLLGASAWRLASLTGETIVVVGLSAAPSPGEIVIVRGVFHVVAAVGDYQAPVIVVR